MRSVVLYSRPGCHLCDEARVILEDLAAEDGDIQLSERNIDEDEDLLRVFLERIPVIELDGRIVGELIPDAEALRHTLLNTSTR